MGYHSSFRIVDTDMDIELLCERLNDFSEQHEWADAGWELYRDSVSGYDTAKWYDWLEDLQQYAQQYPEDYFIILRYGEEAPDMSRIVVRDGMAIEQFPTIVWPK